ncbi:hypothetical protein K461DRAFT_68354 [Myriangium duriaei CBS 260.36]|uniref:Uncharacterized protein n=1 Tax=Myriangium duriaei CBS 260.36 TaxID=1168546 RepID=A0A9P4IUI0_9PEZI|nr:hypothetical protein K461DRAFT_68354 [Myriangium duriaei CBS 260.36]
MARTKQTRRGQPGSHIDSTCDFKQFSNFIDIVEVLASPHGSLLCRLLTPRTTRRCLHNAGQGKTKGTSAPATGLNTPSLPQIPLKQKVSKNATNANAKGDDSSQTEPQDLLKEDRRRLRELEVNISETENSLASPFRLTTRKVAEMGHAKATTVMQLNEKRMQIYKQAIVRNIQSICWNTTNNAINDLHIISTSSSWHMDLISGRKAIDSEVRYPYQDGISDVRASLCKIAQKEKVLRLQAHIDSTLLYGLQRLAITTQEPYEDNGDEFIILTQECCTTAVQRLARHKHGLIDIAVQHIFEPLTEHLFHDEAFVAAIRHLILERWSIEYGHNGRFFKSSATRNGIYKSTKGGGKKIHNLNQEIASMFIKDVDRIVRDIKPYLKLLEDKIRNNGLNATKELREQLERSHKMKHSSMTNFWNNYEKTQEDFIKNLHMRMECIIDRFHWQAMSHLTSEKGFNQGMQLLWNAACDDANIRNSGTRVDTRERLKYVYEQLLKDTASTPQAPQTPLRVYLDALKKTLEGSAKIHYGKIVKLLENLHLAIEGDLKLLFRRHDDIEEADKVVLETAKKRFATARPNIWAMQKEASNQIRLAMEESRLLRESHSPKESSVFSPH